MASSRQHQKKDPVFEFSSQTPGLSFVNTLKLMTLVHEELLFFCVVGGQVEKSPLQAIIKPPKLQIFISSVSLGGSTSGVSGL